MKFKEVDVSKLNVNDIFYNDDKEYIIIEKMELEMGFSKLNITKACLVDDRSDEILIEDGTKLTIEDKDVKLGEKEITLLKQRLYENFQANTQTDMFSKCSQLENHTEGESDDFLIEMLAGLNAAIIYNLMKDEKKGFTITKLLRKINKETKEVLIKFGEIKDEHNKNN